MWVLHTGPREPMKSGKALGVWEKMPIRMWVCLTITTLLLRCTIYATLTNGEHRWPPLTQQALRDPSATCATQQVTKPRTQELHFASHVKMTAYWVLSALNTRGFHVFLLSYTYSLSLTLSFLLTHTHTDAITHVTLRKMWFFVLFFPPPSSTAVYSATQWRYHGNAYLCSWEIGGTVYFWSFIPLSKKTKNKTNTHTQKACVKGISFVKKYKNII